MDLEPPLWVAFAQALAQRSHGIDPTRRDGPEIDRPDKQATARLVMAERHGRYLPPTRVGIEGATHAACAVQLHASK